MFKPVNKTLFVLPDKAIEMAGAIILPATDKRQTVGTVKASDSEMAKAGDRVIFARMSPVPTGVQSELVVVYERDLLGVETDGESMRDGLLAEAGAKGIKVIGGGVDLVG